MKHVTAPALLAAVLAVGCGSEPRASRATASARAPARPVTPRNAVLIVVDSLRADMLTPEQMPHVSRWSSRGRSFHARSASYWSKPSVATLLTSIEPARLQVAEPHSSVPGSAVTLPEVLQCHELRTAAFAANGYVSDRFGFDQGWDTYFNAIREAQPSTADAMVDRALEWIEAHRADPFFVYLHLIDPHVPYQPPPPFLPTGLDDPRPAATAQWVQDAQEGRLTPTREQQKWIRRLYEAEVRFADRELGRFFARLDALGVGGRTLVVLTSSNGESLGEHGRFGHGADVPLLRAVPLVFVGPGAPPAQAEVVDHARVAPTIVAALGFAQPARFEDAPLGETYRERDRRYEYGHRGDSLLDREMCERLRALGYVTDVDCERLPLPATHDEGAGDACETVGHDGGILERVRWRGGRDEEASWAGSRRPAARSWRENAKRSLRLPR